MDNKTQIQFTEQILELASLDVSDILTITALPNHPSDLLCVNPSQEVWRINSITSNSQRICALPNLALSEKTPIQIQISPCQNYAAITRIDYNDDSNYGLVINLQTGEIVFALNDFGYHSEHADFPVAFFSLDNSCLIIYASDWNNLDIINLETKECLTSRKDEEITDKQRENGLFTEWAGELKISPDGKRIATIGWMWHPVGIAWSFSLEKWIKDKWEADFGKSKMQLGEIWEYFWHSPFAWLDNERIIIWGDAETQDSRDIPKNNVIIYNAITGEKLLSFDGPTMDIFEIDGSFLFSGKADGSGISVWNWQTGELISEYSTSYSILTYLPACKTFIARNNNNQLLRLEWTLV